MRFLPPDSGKDGKANQKEEEGKDFMEEDHYDGAKKKSRTT